MKPRLYADLLGFVRAACTHASLSGNEPPVLPFYVKHHAVGWLRPSFAGELRRWPHVFELNSAFVRLAPKPDTTESRTAAMDQVTRELAREGLVVGWREEPVSVARKYGEPELFRIERAATRPFGLMAYGAHMNGYTRRKGRDHAWIARRATSKQVDPGKLDNLVGGRIAAGMSVDETLRKEAWEEAGIAPPLLSGLTCVDAVRVEYSTPEGLHREILFVHDLRLAEDFKPVNQDGEVSEMLCMPVEDVVGHMLEGDFTLDAGVVMINGLMRMGAVLPEDASYLELMRLMKP